MNRLSAALFFVIATGFFDGKTLNVRPLAPSLPLAGGGRRPDVERRIAAREDARPRTTRRAGIDASGKRIEALTKLASEAHDAGRFDSAIEYYEQLLSIARVIRNSDFEAVLLQLIGDLDGRLSRYKDEVKRYEQALPLLRKAKDRVREANVLNALGAAYANMRQNERAISSWEQALTVARESGNKEAEATVMANIGAVYYRLGRYENAISSYKMALSIQQKTSDREAAASTLNRIGLAYNGLSQYKMAISHLEQALSMSQELKDREVEAASLSNLGMAYDGLSQFEKSLSYYEQALPVARELGDKDGQATILNNLGLAYTRLGQYRRAVAYYEQALPVLRESDNREVEAVTLGNIGMVYFSTNQCQESMSYYEQALRILRACGDLAGAAKMLGNLGMAYLCVDRSEKAISLLEEALLQMRKVKNRQGEAAILNNLGAAYGKLSKYGVAINYLEQALPIERDIEDIAASVRTLNNLWFAYDMLGRPDKGIQYIEQALSLARSIKDRGAEASVLSNLGAAHYDLGQYEKADQYLAQALSIAVEVGDRATHVLALNNIGENYRELKQYKMATKALEQAMTIERGAAGRDGAPAAILNNLGMLYGEQGSYEKATCYLLQALPSAMQAGDRPGEAQTLHNLMDVSNSLKRTRLAIYYGKLAVNVVQTIRDDISDLSRELRKGYATSNAVLYRRLAVLLAREGRVREAEQVLLLLKEDELKEFAGPPRKLSVAKTLQLSQHESQVAKTNQGWNQKLVSYYGQVNDLLSRKTRTDAEESRLGQLRSKIDEENARYCAFGKSLGGEFGGPATERDVAVVDPRDSISSLLNVGTVAIYTVFAYNSHFTLLFSSNGAIARGVSVSLSDLTARVLALRQVLTDTRRDPRHAAQDLYSLILAPVADDLDAARARTILWSLDGQLRHLPVAALHDGERYLVEKYGSGLFSSVGKGNHKSTSWNALAVGVSKEHIANGHRFGALRHVPSELSAIVREKDSSRGILPGEVKLDGQFTWRAAKEALLAKSHTVVHIASHFEFEPGNMASSFLLLGDGNTLSLGELRKERELFHNVDLLTLSACNTAAEGDGREVDSFAKIVQAQGAESVLATLWSVNDPSTSQLMGRFYAVHEATPNTSKSEALREAQLELLHGGSTMSLGAREAKSGREVHTGITAKPIRSGRDYSHPYYWSPFILMGDWN